MRVSFRFVMALFLAPVLACAAPVFEGLPTAQAANVDPTIPVAKALILPVSVYDDAAPATQPTITATSSNPHVFVRIRTGNPLLKMHLTHTGPAIDDDVVFQLFDDLTPKTAAYLSGFAESGYLDGAIFQRIADLNSGNPGPSRVHLPGRRSK